MFMEANRLRFYVCIFCHFLTWLALLCQRIKLDGSLSRHNKWMQLGLFNIFWMSNIYMQGQMAELNEPVKIIIYLTLVSVDASVMFAIALLSREVVVGRSVFMCL